MTAALPQFGHSTDYRQVPIRSLIDAALVIRPTGTRRISTATGQHTAVTADVYVIDGEHANTLEFGYLFFNSMITNALTESLTTGGVVVARLKRGVMASSGRQFLYLSPINLFADRELLVQADVIARAQGWLS